MNNCSDASSKFKVFNTFSNKYREQKCKIDVDTMNDFFTNIGQRLADSIKKTANFVFESPSIEQTCALHFADEIEMNKVITSLKNKASSGHDGLSNNIVQICAPVIAPYLTSVFNQCIHLETFPDSFKIAKILGLHKEGSWDIPNNYRPISLLTSFSKIFEKLL